jgi:hypothetical protein
MLPPGNRNGWLIGTKLDGLNPTVIGIYGVFYYIKFFTRAWPSLVKARHFTRVKSLKDWLLISSNLQTKLKSQSKPINQNGNLMLSTAIRASHILQNFF